MLAGTCSAPETCCDYVSFLYFANRVDVVSVDKGIAAEISCCGWMVSRSGVFVVCSCACSFLNRFPSVLPPPSAPSLPPSFFFPCRLLVQKKKKQTIEERSDPNSTFPRVLVFPEGTCTNQRALITFKHGPFITGQNIQPVAVRYPRCEGELDPSYPAVAPSLVALALR